MLSVSAAPNESEVISIVRDIQSNQISDKALIRGHKPLQIVMQKRSFDEILRDHSKKDGLFSSKGFFSKPISMENKPFSISD